MTEFYYKAIDLVHNHERVELVRNQPRMMFLEDLNRWNQMGRGDFVYYEVSYLTYENYLKKKNS